MISYPFCKKTSLGDKDSTSRKLDNTDRGATKVNASVSGAEKLKKLDGPDNLHRPNSHLTRDKEFLKSLPSKLPINWPAMADDKAWDKFSDKVFEK